MKKIDDTSCCKCGYEFNDFEIVEAIPIMTIKGAYCNSCYDE